MNLNVYVHTSDESETLALGERLGTLLGGGSVVLLDGDLGAGKTRLAKGIARGLGVTRELTSPSFNLVLEYPLTHTTEGARSHTAEGARAHATEGSPARVLRHFDLYRLERAEQLDDLDYFGLIEQEDAISLVEWGSRFAEELPLDFLRVLLTVARETPDRRCLAFSAWGARSNELLARFAASEGAALHG
jgi:tRNA threonylcarbamoyladenosine biosynthesis protein TsaE